MRKSQQHKKNLKNHALKMEIDNRNTEPERNATTEQTEQPKQVDSWSFLPLLLSVCKETNETLTTIYDFPISLTLYLGSYIIQQNEKQAKELEQQRLKYKR